MRGTLVMSARTARGDPRGSRKTELLIYRMLKEAKTKIHEEDDA